MGMQNIRESVADSASGRPARCKMAKLEIRTGREKSLCSLNANGFRNLHSTLIAEDEADARGHEETTSIERLVQGSTSITSTESKSVEGKAIATLSHESQTRSYVVGDTSSEIETDTDQRRIVQVPILSLIHI